MPDIPLTTLILKLPRGTEVTPEAAQTFFSTITKINPAGTLDRLLMRNQKPFALEIASVGQQIRFQITCHPDLVAFVETQIQSNYPLVIIEKGKDPLVDQPIEILKVFLKKGNYYPITPYSGFADIDPMSSILSVLSKAQEGEVTLVQYALESTDSSWQSGGANFAAKGTKKEDGSYAERSDASVIKEKISYPGFLASIRIISNTKKTLTDLSSAFGVFTRSDGNSFFSLTPSRFNLKPAEDKARKRLVFQGQILNIVELATLWHLPSEKVKVPGIIWGHAVLSEPPANLPVATGLTEDQKKAINFFGKTIFKNHETIFGIKDKDRLRHIWNVGKTGTGKSTMLANMVIDDFKKDRGIAIIDPHGDLADELLNYIPSRRINQTIYFNPADRDYPIILNPLEVTNREEAELVVSGLMSIFTKIWANVWSARMEYILRNCFLTLAELPNSTLEDVLKILVDASFRTRILSKISDKTLVDFWKSEYEKMPDRLQKEAIAPIQNKVGQFVTSPMIRRIIGNPRSTISIDEIMNEGKILICNLSQGRLGEDNSALLGATIISKFQIAAMRRIDTPQETRVPYFLYVDEFQNFATDSFIKILSEVRKFGLGLTLANQYMAQIPEPVQKAILGNAGSLITFAVGADDSAIIHKEFAEVFTQNDLVNLQNFQVATKMMIDGHTSRPFLANTLPLPISRNQHKEKVIKVSRERYAKKASVNVEATNSPAKIPSSDVKEDVETPTTPQGNI